MPSPNIWEHPATYEIENHAFDRDGLVESAMASIASWQGRGFLDLGCGSGFHLPRWAKTASRVIGVEPHHDLAAMARRRVGRASTANIEVLDGTAQRIPLPDDAVDVVQVRWAYFFGPGCEPGLAELDRVIARGGTAFVIDNDSSTSTFGGWFNRGYPMIDAVEVERFWSGHGWRRTSVLTDWRFESRADFEAVVRIEFDRQTAKEILAEYPGTQVDYAVNVWSRDY